MDRDEIDTARAQRNEARQQRDDARAELANVHHNAEMWYAEKLQAEAEVRNLRAELDDDYRASMDNERAAIARARAVPGLNQTTLSVLVKDVLRALDGGTE